MSKLAVYGLVLAGIVLCLIGIFFYKTPLENTGPSPTGKFGNVSLSLEYATTTAEQQLGLGNRPTIPQDYGMLFAFPNDDTWGFWMKDTLVPLDMFWLNDQGQVIWTEEDVATDTYPAVFYPPEPARYVLETAAGFAAAHDIATGTPLRLQNWPKISE